MVPPNQNYCRMRFRYFLRLQYTSHLSHVWLGAIDILGVAYVTKYKKYTMMCQTQQTFIIFFVVLGQHVSILIE